MRCAHVYVCWVCILRHVLCGVLVSVCFVPFFYIGAHDVVLYVQTGPYVEGLSKHAVGSFHEVGRLLDSGNLCRSVAVRAESTLTLSA